MPHRAAAALALLALAATGPAAVEPTLLDEVRAHMEAALGEVPATLLVNGRAVRTDEALAPLLGAPLQPRQWAAPTRDLGLGYRVGPEPCMFAALILAEAWGNPPPEAFVEEQVRGLLDPGPGFRCWGPASQAFAHGAATARVGPQAQHWYACLPSGGFWLDQNPGCHVRDWGNATVAGHVGRLDMVADQYHLEVLFCGVLGHTPDVGGDRDVCPVVLSRDEPLQDLVRIEG